MRQEYSLTEIKDLFADKEKYADKKVTVGGWIRSNRDSKKIGLFCAGCKTEYRFCGYRDRHDRTDTQGKTAL